MAPMDPRPFFRTIPIPVNQELHVHVAGHPRWVAPCRLGWHQSQGRDIWTGSDLETGFNKDRKVGCILRDKECLRLMAEGYTILSTLTGLMNFGANFQDPLRTTNPFDEDDRVELGTCADLPASESVGKSVAKQHEPTAKCFCNTTS